MFPENDLTEFNNDDVSERKMDVDPDEELIHKIRDGYYGSVEKVIAFYVGQENYDRVKDRL